MNGLPIRHFRRWHLILWLLSSIWVSATLIPRAAGQSQQMVSEIELLFKTTAESVFAETFTLSLLDGNGTLIETRQVTMKQREKTIKFSFKTPKTFPDLNQMSLRLERPMYPHNLLFGKHDWSVVLSITAHLTNNTEVIVAWPERTFGGHTRNTYTYDFQDADQVSSGSPTR
jgi:hypothetical protein